MRAFAAWALAVAAFVAAYASYGWRGMALAATVVVFWLALQFSRVQRVMRRVAQRPLGTTPSAVMLAARLKPGQPLLEVLPVAGSLGSREPDEAVSGKNVRETFRWTDAGGVSVVATFDDGRLVRHALVRPADAAPSNASADPSLRT